MTGCPWVCPVCRMALEVTDDCRRYACAKGHSFDASRRGYVNLLIAGQRRSRQPGDSVEMVDARRRFLATGLYDRITDAVAHVVARAAVAVHERHPGEPVMLLDIGCGDGHHTRRVAGNMTSGGGGLDPVDAIVAGIDISKAAVALAAPRHRAGWYAVGSAADLPMAPRAVDVALSVFGPVVVEELARVVREGGAVVAVHPGPAHLMELRELVYPEARVHEVKDPLRSAAEWFTRAGTMTVTFPIAITDPHILWDLFAMTPYRWHAPPDIRVRLNREAARPGGFATQGDVVISSYRRRPPMTHL